jgi:LmbE family N-acetylglucosaminyl deacetylase
MDSHKTVLAISPHLDDAALSIGATLAKWALRGVEVHVCTLFAGTPVEPLSSVARRFHDMCDLPHDASAIALRRQEDLTAMTVLGAQAHHEDFLDAVYRRRSDGRWLCEHERAMFDTCVKIDPLVRKSAIESIDTLCTLLSPDVILTCAGVGGHIDHQITRDAAVTVGRSSGTQLMLWEDLPYALEEGLTFQMDQLVTTTSMASPTAWTRKWEAIACYRSQTRMLWPGREDWSALLASHAFTRSDPHGAELLWSID